MSAKEKLARLKQLNEHIKKTGELTMDQAKELNHLAFELRSYKCLECGGYIIEGEKGKDYVLTFHPFKKDEENRWHLECKTKRDKRTEKISKRMKEEQERIKHIKYEHEHSLRPKIWFFPHAAIYGLKKDFEHFKKELPTIPKK